MTKKDYELIAAAVRHERGEWAEDTWTKDIEIGRAAVVLAIAHALAQDNPRFDRDRFLKACDLV